VIVDVVVVGDVSGDVVSDVDESIRCSRRE